MITEASSAKMYANFTGFDDLKKSARENAPEALHQVAKQFESLFIQMVMKSMRSANHFFADENTLDSGDVEFYQEMYDQQMSLHLGQGKGLGLAQVLERQLGPRTADSPSTVESGAPTQKASLSQPQVKQFVQMLKATQDDPSLLEDIALPEIKNAKVKQDNKPSKVQAPIYKTPVDFVKAIWPTAIQYAKKLNVDPKMLVAQAALETGWGKSIIQAPDGSSSHNLFNIKADKRTDGNAVAKVAVEYNDGMLVKKQEHFRKYQDHTESFSDYFDLLTQNSRYANAIDNARDPKKYIHALQQGGYATDPKYADKVYQIYKSDILNKAIAQIG